MSHEITLQYHGKAVEGGRMDSYEIAADIVAFSDFLGITAQAAYGTEAKLRTEIRAFAQGSFAVQFAVDVGGILATLISGIASPKDIFAFIKQSFDLWKHLRGNPPQSVTHVDNNQISVTNNHGEVKIFRAETLNIVADDRAGGAVGKFVKGALESDLDRVTIATGNEVIAEATASEAPHFVPLPLGLPMFESVIKAALTIESAVFKEGNKWRFSDGQTTFFANIEDVEFLARIDAGVARFGKGDVLIVDLKITQYPPLQGLKTERSIVKVHDHRTRAQQSPLM